MKITTQILSLPEEFPTLDWRDLLSRSGADGLFLSPDWLLPWWRVFGPQEGRKAGLVTIREGGRLIGLAPLLTRTHYPKRGVPVRRLELWGSGERTQDAICTDYLEVIAETGREQQVADAFVQVTRRWPGGWHECIIPLMNGQRPMPHLLAEAFRRAGYVAEIKHVEQSPYIDLPATWDEYLAMLAGPNRSLVRRTLRDFDVWAGGEAVLHEAKSLEELQRGKQVLHALHQERWSGGVFGSRHFRAFHDEAMTNLLSRGALRLFWLSVGTRPVAALYSMEWSKKVSFYQCGRAQGLPSQVRVGIVILLLAIRRAIESGCREFDFLAGAARYKRQLAPSLRPLVELHVVKPGGRETVRKLVDWGKSLFRLLRTRLMRPKREEGALAGE